MTNPANKTSVFFCLLNAIKPWCRLALIGLGCLAVASHAAQPAADKTATQNPDIAPPIQVTPQLGWNTEQQLLRQTSSADDSFWVEVSGGKNLVLKHRPNGRKVRGSIFLLATHGENADHQRLVKPLAEQLAFLGWEVWLPNLALEDIATAQQRANTTQSNEPAPVAAAAASNPAAIAPASTPASQPTSAGATIPKHFFSDSKAYQAYFNQLLNQTTQLESHLSNGMVLIANGTAAYWALELTKNRQPFTQVILIEPQLPRAVKTEWLLEKLEPRLLDQQTLPVFTITQGANEDYLKQDAFVKAFTDKQWQTNYQRFSHNVMETSKIEKEDNRIAKSITGWLDLQRKSP